MISRRLNGNLPYRLCNFYFYIKYNVFTLYSSIINNSTTLKLTTSNYCNNQLYVSTRWTRHYSHYSILIYINRLHIGGSVYRHTHASRNIDITISFYVAIAKLQINIKCLPIANYTVKSCSNTLFYLSIAIIFAKR